MAIVAPRKPNALQRRSDLADAAIELLGAGGARGLSHPKVDAHAGMPAGTTSFYFRTRKALLLGVAERLTALDIDDLTSLGAIAVDGVPDSTGTAGLARLVMNASNEPWLTRSRARYEMVMDASRDPDLDAILQQATSRFYGLARDVVAQWHPADAPPDRTVIRQQTIAAFSFVNGVMMSFVAGRPAVSDAAHLDRLLGAVIAASEAAIDDHST